MIPPSACQTRTFVRARSPTAPAAPDPAPKAKAAPAEPVSAEGWMDAGGGYALGIRDGGIVAQILVVEGQAVEGGAKLATVE